MKKKIVLLPTETRNLTATLAFKKAAEGAVNLQAIIVFDKYDEPAKRLIDHLDGQGHARYNNGLYPEIAESQELRRKVSGALKRHSVVIVVAEEPHLSKLAGDTFQRTIKPYLVSGDEEFG